MGLSALASASAMDALSSLRPLIRHNDRRRGGPDDLAATPAKWVAYSSG